MNLDFPLPQQDPCFFCEIVADRQANLVEETDLVIARVNGRQYLEGQCVVFPKRHAPTLFDLSDLEVNEVLKLARRVGRAVFAAVGAEGLLLYQNNGVASGQEVPHFHLHVVPQWMADSPKGKFPPHICRSEGIVYEKVGPTRLNAEELAQMSARIREHLPD